MTAKPFLGELLVKNGFLQQEIIDEALRIQVGSNRRLGHILVRMKTITADQLAETLAKQLDIPITDIAEKYTREVSRILPRYLCRQYNVIPLELKQNNVLVIAMADPSEGESIASLEHYTGKVIEPCLARHSDIEKEIGRRIPLTLNDFFTPQTNTWATRAVAALSLILVIGLSLFTYDYVKKTRYGTVTSTDTHVLFTNHDLIMGIDKNGKISLLGHGAFSKGYYSVTFNNFESLEAFIHSKEKDFSEKQRDWIDWAIKQIDAVDIDRAIAPKK